MPQLITLLAVAGWMDQHELQILDYLLENRDGAIGGSRAHCPNLGHEIARSTLAEILERHGIEPAPERSRKTIDAQGGASRASRLPQTVCGCVRSAEIVPRSFSWRPSRRKTADLFTQQTVSEQRRLLQLIFGPGNVAGWRVAIVLSGPV